MRGFKSELPSRPADRKLGGHGGSTFRIPQVPIEWLDAGSWRLPSGKALAEFALQSGFLAPLLFKTPMPFKAKTFASGSGHAVAGRTKPLEKEGR